MLWRNSLMSDCCDERQGWWAVRQAFTDVIQQSPRRRVWRQFFSYFLHPNKKSWEDFVYIAELKTKRLFLIATQHSPFWNVLINIHIEHTLVWFGFERTQQTNEQRNDTTSQSLLDESRKESNRATTHSFVSPTLPEREQEVKATSLQSRPYLNSANRRLEQIVSNLLSSLEGMVVARHVRHDGTLIRLRRVDQI